MNESVRRGGSVAAVAPGPGRVEPSLQRLPDPANPKVGDRFLNACNDFREVTAVGPSSLSAVDLKGKERAASLSYVEAYWRPIGRCTGHPGGTGGAT